MDDEYYGNTPKKIPFVAIAITSFLGSQSHLVASMINQLTGLPLIDLDQWIEHKAGKSILSILTQHGETHMRLLENDLLPKAVNAKPPGIIALGDGTLIDEANQKLVNESCILVYLDYDPENLINLLRNDVQRFPGKYPTFFKSSATTVTDIKFLLETRLPGYQKADYFIQGVGKSIASMAKEIIETLDL